MALYINPHLLRSQLESREKETLIENEKTIWPGDEGAFRDMLTGDLIPMKEMKMRYLKREPPKVR